MLLFSFSLSLTFSFYICVAGIETAASCLLRHVALKLSVLRILLMVCLEARQTSKPQNRRSLLDLELYPRPSPHSTILPPPQSKFFSLKYKQNIGRKMEFRMEVWYSSNWNLLCESYACPVFYLQMIQCLFKNAKQCVVNTLIYASVSNRDLWVNTLDFENFQVDSTYSWPYTKIWVVGRLG
jgi:hypothetical protein